MAKHDFIGKVARLYVREGATNIRLELPIAERAADTYFVLPQTHENYNALYSLALTAAVNGYDLWVRTTDDVDANDPAEVRYLVVDW